MTRIVAGVAGGRRLAVPGKGTRPTSDRVREALFSALESTMDLADTRVLDLYAGTGALGLEALSRGARTAVFVESDAGALTVLRKNIAAVGLPGVVRPGRVASVLEAGTDTPFDLVLADPPYVLASLHTELAALVAGGWTHDETVIVVERAKRAGAVDWPEPLAARKVRHYGDTSLHWGQRREQEHREEAGERSD